MRSEGMPNGPDNLDIDGRGCASCRLRNDERTHGDQRGTRDCLEMEKDMGLGTPHDHAAMKGTGRNAMNLSHDRCVQILAQPG